ncbi:biotin--[acetyl-CoA-carboxylase] ligase [Latilactobacillus sakei]
MSLLLPDIPLNEEATLLTPLSAVAVVRAIRAVCQIETQIKWVNDIYYEGQKVVGILAESIPHHGIVIGIGIDFKDDGQLSQLVEKAGVLLPNTSPITRNQLISQILLEFDRLLPTYRQKEFMAEYREVSLLITKKIVIRLNEEKTLTGYVQDITNNGELVIQTVGQRLQIIRAGEVERVLSW